MDVNELLGHARDAMTVKRVFGDPYEKDGITFVPVANVMGGAGAGGGTGMAAKAKAKGSEDEPEAVEGAAPGTPDSGYGMGYGMKATPAGAYVIKDGVVEWEPAVDMNALFMQRAIVAVVGLLVLRSVVKIVFKR
jgi:uncharacterized spore protein YtfJ